MEIVIQLRSDLAKLMRGDVGPGAVTDELRKIKQDLEEAVRRFGATLEPMHPGVEDAELARYFTLSNASELDSEQALVELNDLKAVTAAYAKPQAAPA